MQWDLADPLGPAIPDAGERKESAASRAALLDFAQLGPRRSLTKLMTSWGGRANAPTTEPNTLKTWSMRFEWQARVARWDELELERNEAEWEERRKRDKDTRLQFVQAARGKVVQALSKLETDGIAWADVFSAMHMVNDEMRREYGDDVKRLDVTSGAKPVPAIREIVVNLPIAEDAAADSDTLAA